MAKIAALLGKTADATSTPTLASSLAAEYNTKYLHVNADGTAYYANNTEASNAVALDAGLVPDQYKAAVQNSLVAAVHAYGDRIGTGSVAIGPLFRTLHAAGRDDVIYTMVANPASPGYAFLVNSGYTTLGESLSRAAAPRTTTSWARSPPGSCTAWSASSRRPARSPTRAWRSGPQLVGDLNHAEGTYTTPQGDAAANWTRAANGLLSSLAVTVPANTTARVYVPTSSPTETFVANGGAGRDLRRLPERRAGLRRRLRQHDVRARHERRHRRRAAPSRPRSRSRSGRPPRSGRSRRASTTTTTPAPPPTSSAPPVTPRCR